VLGQAVRYGQNIAYMDLYCGPGRYDDGTKSTPLLILEKAIASRELQKHLVTVFNDKKAASIAKLQTETAKLPGIASLKNAPVFLNEKVNTETEKLFTGSKMPSFTFIEHEMISVSGCMTYPIGDILVRLWVADQNVSKKFVSSWIDNHSTGIMQGEGELTDNGKSITWEYKANCPITKKPMTMKEVDTMIGGNSKTLEMWGDDPKSGKNYKMMKIELTRK